MNTSQKKGTVFIVDLATEKLAEAIHKAGYQAGALILWHDRVTPSSWAVKASGYDIELRMSTKDPLEKIEQALREAAPNIVGIIPTNEPSEEVACRLAERFGLPHNDPDIAAVRWNKAKVKELAQAAGLRVPKFKACYSPKEVLKFSKELTFPIIIKTPQGSASVNVFKCHSEKDLIEKYHVITTTPDDFGNQPNYCVVEEYIGGQEYQVNIFSDGEETHVTDIWLTEKIDSKYASNLYYNSWLVSPDDPEMEKICQYSIRVAEVTSIRYGPGHIEVKVDEKGPALIEAHARFGGGRQPEFLQELSSFDPYDKTVKVFTKSSAHIPQQITFNAYAAVASCPIVTTREKREKLDIKAIHELPSYHSEISRFGFANQSARPTTNLSNCPFRVWLKNKTQEQLHRDADLVHKLFRDSYVGVV